MSLIRDRMIVWLASLNPKWLPFADIATPDLSLARLLRLSLFQVTTGMALVLLVGTLNRVMIVELGVPASLVGIMVALPIVFAPFRALIGFRSDHHRSKLGWRRMPFVWKGTLYQFCGFAMMPFALLVLAGKGQAAEAPAWIGQATAALAFLMVGGGLHTVQTAGLALATDLTPRESHPKVVGLMYVMLLLGMIASALAFGKALENFAPGRLVQVIQAAAVTTILLNGIAMWKQETRHPTRGQQPAGPDPTFAESWARFCAGSHAVRRLAIVGLGTMAFGMADILLEPFGGQILDLTVSATTQLTALFAVGGLIGFAASAHIVGRGLDAYRMAQLGALIGIPAFALVMAAEPFGMLGLFLLGNFLIGFGAALFAHGTLTAAMNEAPRREAGLALGAWGAVQATAAGLAMGLSGVLRDLVTWLLGGREAVSELTAITGGYLTVYALEILLLLATIVAIVPLIRASARRQAHAEEEPVPASPTAVKQGEP